MMLSDEEIVVAIAQELRRRGEKRIKSVFINPDGALSVFLKGDQVIGRKSFNWVPAYPEKISEWPSVEVVVDAVLDMMEKEVLTRPDTEVERHASVPEEEYEGEQQYKGD